MPGHPSEAVVTPAELAGERQVRITNIYATPWHAAESIEHHDLHGYLKLGRLERYYRQSADQLPRVLRRAELDPAVLKFTRWSDAARVTSARIWLVRMPSGQVVTVLSLDARCSFIGTIDVLEDCYYCDVLVDDVKGHQELPGGGHELCPLAAIRSARLRPPELPGGVLGHRFHLLRSGAGRPESLLCGLAGDVQAGSDGRP